MSSFYPACTGVFISSIKLLCFSDGLSAVPVFPLTVYTACRVWARASGSPVPNLCHLSLKNDSPEHPSTCVYEGQVYVIYFYRQAMCDWIMQGLGVGCCGGGGKLSSSF